MMRLETSLVRRGDGYALLSVTVLIAVLLTAGVASLELARTELHSTADQAAKQRAFYIAERGIQHGLAKLDQDRSGSITTTYSASLSDQSFGDGIYSVTIAQDSLYPTNPTRKLITSVGRLANQQSTITAHAVVQDVASTIQGGGGGGGGGGETNCSDGVDNDSNGLTDCQDPACGSNTTCGGSGGTTPMMFCANGTCTLSTKVDLASGVFNGNIVSNNNVEIDNLAALASHGKGSIYAHNAFSVGGVASADSTITGELHSGVAYTASGSCVPLLGVCTPARYTFTGGKYVDSPATRPFPYVDWTAIKRDSRTIIVRKGQVPAGTNWISGTNSWNAGNFATTADTDKIYYVEGNASFNGLTIAKGAKITVAARGTVSLNTITLLSTGLANGSSEAVRLIGLGNVSVGSSSVTGLDLGLGGSVLGLVTNHTFSAYSETGNVSLYVGSVNAAVRNYLNMVAYNDALLSFTATVANTTNVYN